MRHTLSRISQGVVITRWWCVCRTTGVWACVELDAACAATRSSTAAWRQLQVQSVCLPSCTANWFCVFLLSCRYRGTCDFVKCLITRETANKINAMHRANMLVFKFMCIIYNFRLLWILDISARNLLRTELSLAAARCLKTTFWWILSL